MRWNGETNTSMAAGLGIPTWPIHPSLEHGISISAYRERILTTYTGKHNDATWQPSAATSRLNDPESVAWDTAARLGRLKADGLLDSCGGQLWPQPFGTTGAKAVLPPLCRILRTSHSAIHSWRSTSLVLLQSKSSPVFQKDRRGASYAGSTSIARAVTRHLEGLPTEQWRWKTITPTKHVWTPTIPCSQAFAVCRFLQHRRLSALAKSGPVSSAQDPGPGAKPARGGCGPYLHGAEVLGEVVAVDDEALYHAHGGDGSAARLVLNQRALPEESSLGEAADAAPTRQV